MQPRSKHRSSPRVLSQDNELFSKYFNPLESVEIIVSYFSFKWSRIVIAGMTCPPEPPVEINTFSLTYYIFLFVKFKLIPVNIEVLTIEEPP